MAVRRALTLLAVITALRLCGGRDQDIALCTSAVCLTVHMDKLSFDEAHGSCVHSGGSLVTIRDREEEAVFQSILSRIVRRHREQVLGFWIGLRLHKGDCVLPEKSLRGFKWVSADEDSRYSNWEKEPVSTCTEKLCVMVHYPASGQGGLRWVAAPCRAQTFYACKFHFQGMCRPLAITGPGKILYTPPFSEQPLTCDLQSLPLGTVADVLCGDGLSHYSLCRSLEDSYGWTSAGPFCASGESNCDFNNGGCEHLCLRDTGGPRCACREGYELGQDAASCHPRDHCGHGTCQHQCVPAESGYSCVCPKGFQLDTNRHTCSDIDECHLQACEEHLCVNTDGSYTCQCEPGYRMSGSKCHDVDECAESRCAQSCLNSLGSFSCHCGSGFTLAADGHSCEDVDECLTDHCEFKCINTPGSFLCVCPENSHTHGDGTTCSPILPEASTRAALQEPTQRLPQEDTGSAAHTTATLQHQSVHTSPAAADVESSQPKEPQDSNSTETSRPMTVDKLFSPKLLMCIIGSLVSSLFLVIVTLIIVVFRCKRRKREAKQNTTADGYCWVSSGLEPHLEKFYNSILTDDL